jgi:hypothetical protein
MVGVVADASKPIVASASNAHTAERLPIIDRADSDM